MSVVRGMFQIPVWCHQEVMVVQGGLAFPALVRGCLTRATGSSSIIRVVVNTGSRKQGFKEAVPLHDCGLDSGALRHRLWWFNLLAMLGCRLGDTGTV